MHRSVSVSVILCVLVMGSCAKDQGTSTMQGSDAHATERFQDGYETPPSHDTNSKVMQAKLANSQAILEGLALADFGQIEKNALALRSISKESDSLGQESAAYFELSAKFRSVCDDLANHARAKNLQAAVTDYSALTHSCIACHTYLREQRQAKDMPGRVSMK